MQGAEQPGGAGYPDAIGNDNSQAAPTRPKLERTNTEDWRGLAVNDLVQLGAGEPGSEVLYQGEVGQVLRDLRYGDAPFQVQGPRGLRAWYRGESLMPFKSRSRTLSGSRGARRVPLIQQVVEALDPNTQVDFPRITDICEAAAQNPAGADVAVAVLTATLGEQELRPGDTRDITQDYLKVLTILNEMLYDDDVAEVLRCTSGLQSALERLKMFGQRDGDATGENIRMLANEVLRRIFQVNARTARPTARAEIISFCPEGHLLTWLAGQPMFQIHGRACALCKKNLPRQVERYTCAMCHYHNVCVSCIRWGAPRRPKSADPIGLLSDFLAEPTATRRAHS